MKNQKNTNGSLWIFISVILSILIVDQLLKHLLKNASLIVIPGVLRLIGIKNIGAAFGLFEEYGFLIIWVSIIVLGFLLYYYDSYTDKEYYLIAVLIGGILGNLIDRIFLGYVIDFIKFPYYPAFNIADIAISVSIILLIYRSAKK